MLSPKTLEGYRRVHSLANSRARRARLASGREPGAEASMWSPRRPAHGDQDARRFAEPDEFTVAVEQRTQAPISVLHRAISKR
jgi:hypothetical protein